MFRLPCAVLRRGLVFSTVRRSQSIVTTPTCDGERVPLEVVRLDLFVVV